MPPSFVNVNGVVTRSPGVKVEAGFRSPTGRQVVGPKRLSVVGNFPMLEQNEPVLVTSQAAMLALDPTNPAIKRAASIIYRPARDPRVGNGPSEIWLCSAAAVTRAYKTIAGWSTEATTIALASDGDELPQATINVEDTTDFPASGTITVETDDGRQVVTYTGKGAGTFTGCSGGTGAMATGGVVRLVSGNTITFRARPRGYAGNRIKAALTIDTSGRYTFTFTCNGRQPEVYANIEAENLFSLAYTGDDTFTVTGGFASGEFFVAATKAGIAIGTFACDCAWDGAVLIDPSIEPNASETYTVTITGTDKVTSETGVTSVLTWTNGGGHAAKSSAVAGTPVRTFSHIDQIVFAQAGGIASAPTFTVSGDMVRTTSERHPYVGDLIEYLQELSDDLTVSGIGELASAVQFDDIDAKGATSLATAVPFTNLKSTLIASLSTSALVEVESVATGSEPAPFSSYLAGGSQTAPTDGDWAPACAALRSEETRHNVISLLASSQAAHDALIEHCAAMWGIAGYEAQGYTGHAANETKANIKSRQRYFNDYRIVPVPQGGTFRLLDGSVATLVPYEVGLLAASMQCSVGLAIPLTRKRSNLLTVTNGPTWSLKADLQEMLAAGCFLFVPTEDGIVVHRALTSHLSDADPARTAPSAVESYAAYILRVRARLETVVGDPAVKTTKARIESIVLDESRAALADNVISALDEESIIATYDENNDVWEIAAGVAPIYEITHIGFKPQIIPVSFGVRLAA